MSSGSCLRASSLGDAIVGNERATKRRKEWFRQYYRRNADRLNARARHRHQMRYWTAWLLDNLEWPVEPTPIYPDPYPIRRPTLHLPQRVR